MARVFRAYDAALRRRPIVTKVATAYLLFGICDFNGQLCTSEVAKRPSATWQERLDAIQWSQVAGFACVAFYNAPAMHNYFRIAAARGWPLWARVAGNSVIMGPFNISAVILMGGFVKAVGRGEEWQRALDSTFSTWRTTFPSTFALSLAVWPPAHLFNWLMLVPRYRVLFFNSCALVWNSYLTFRMWLIERRQLALHVPGGHHDDCSSAPDHHQRPLWRAHEPLGGRDQSSRMEAQDFALQDQEWRPCPPPRRWGEGSPSGMHEGAWEPAKVASAVEAGVAGGDVLATWRIVRVHAAANAMGPSED